MEHFDGILDYDFHPPDDLRLFSIPRNGVLRADEEAVVYEVRYGDVALRHYAFRDYWFKINCTVDLDGRFVETGPGPDDLGFAFNCDIATPMVRSENAVFAVDLCIDFLVRFDGVGFEVVDQDEFEVAACRKWFSEREIGGARTGVDELKRLIEGRQLVDFLERFYPIGPSTAPPATAMQRMPVESAPLVLPGQRLSW